MLGWNIGKNVGPNHNNREGSQVFHSILLVPSTCAPEYKDNVKVAKAPVIRLLAVAHTTDVPACGRQQARRQPTGTRTTRSCNVLWCLRGPPCEGVSMHSRSNAAP